MEIALLWLLYFEQYELICFGSADNVNTLSITYPEWWVMTKAATTEVLMGLDWLPQ